MPIPRPERFERREGCFRFAPGCSLSARGAIIAAAHLRESLRSIGAIDLLPADAPGRIRLELDPDARDLGTEGYRLVVGRDSIEVRAYAEAGLFYAVQTLLNLLPTGPGAPLEIPCCAIDDHPRFRWRGMHLDVSRHFFPAERVREAIDWCAMHKLNVFHWHLTDDQGWRLPIARYPALTEVGARRRSPDGTIHEGAYTVEEVREVIAYAGERFVTIVPEIEMPGHARAAIAAYPHLSCSSVPLPVPAEWGIFDDVLCAGKDTTIEFIEGVLAEVAALFPGPFVHIGGDECPKVRWRDCGHCRERMVREGIRSPEALQGWFTARAGRHLSSLGKRMIGWDEILEGGVPDDAAVMSWRGFEGGVEAIGRGHDVVMSPTDHCYFDYYQGPRETEPAAFPRDLPLEAVYAFEPVPSGLAQPAAARILGGQANVWTERIPTWEHLQYMVFPRLCAMAEVLWSSTSGRDFEEFLARLREHLASLDRLGIRYRPLA